MHPVSAWWYDFDRRYIKPFLTVNQGHPLYMTFPQPWCQPIVKLFSKSREDTRGEPVRGVYTDEERIEYGGGAPKVAHNGGAPNNVYVSQILLMFTF